MKTSTPTYKNHRFPPEIISHSVWLYFRFCLSYRDVEELLFARGIMVTYEATRKWCLKLMCQHQAGRGGLGYHRSLWAGDPSGGPVDFSHGLRHDLASGGLPRSGGRLF